MKMKIIKRFYLIKESKAIAIPLPKRIQQRNDRAAAYELSKKESVNGKILFKL